MSRSIFAHNKFHLGDALQSLHLLRALAKQNDQTPFVFFTNGCNIPQLREVVEDLPNILLEPFESPLWAEHEEESINCWKNFHDAWVTSPLRWNWSEYHLWWHKVVANKMGLESPFTVREHLLLDYPALNKSWSREIGGTSFLIGDSAPSSGQYSEWADHSKEPLLPLMDALCKAGHLVAATSTLRDQGYTISQIGVKSMQYHHHIMVANAPFFCTLNVHNHHYHEGRRRIVMLDNGENLEMPHIEQCSSVAAVMQIAKEAGWI